MQLVSILIPNYNKAPFIRETLDSVLAQTYTHWECVIVDDHSTDHSWEILEEYAEKDPRFQLYKRPKNRLPGGNAARNFAFEMSNGEFINWLDSDDILHPKMIDEKIREFNKQPNLDFVIGMLKKFEFELSLASSVTDTVNLSHSDSNIPLNFLQGNLWLQTSLPFFKKEYIRDLKMLFDESIKKGQESEFFIRIFLRKPNFGFTSKSITYYRIGHDSMNEKFLKNSESERQIYSFFYHRHNYYNIINFRRLDKNETQYFKWFFGWQLETMTIKLPEYMELMKFGLSSGLFPNYFYVFKVLVIRVLKFLRIKE